MKRSVGVKWMSIVHVKLMMVRGAKRDPVGRRDRQSDARCKAKVRCQER